MGAIQRGTATYLVERFWTIDPLTAIPSPADPTTVVFTVQDPDGAETTYTFGVDVEVTNPEVGAYVLLLEPPLPTGIWTCLVVGTGAVAAEDEFTFEILASGVLAPQVPTVATYGPCQPWINGADVAAYDSTLGVGSNTFELEDVAAMASGLLWEASGRQFNGICQRTVRPCAQQCSCWGSYAAGVSPNYWDWGWAGIPGQWGFGWGWRNECGDTCGCGTLSEVRLGGYPVREILEVKIGGVVLDEFDGPSGARNWRLDRRRDLVRMDDPGPPVASRFWPACQNQALDDDQPGTFAITYTWGQQPPMLGKMAAATLAVELWNAITPGRDCKLPTSVTRVVRTGITIERIVPTAKMLRQGSTGLQAIDTFLAMVNPTGMRRRPAVWFPGMKRYARKVGQ